MEVMPVRFNAFKEMLCNLANILCLNQNDARRYNDENVAKHYYGYVSNKTYFEAQDIINRISSVEKYMPRPIDFGSYFGYKKPDIKKQAVLIEAEIRRAVVEKKPLSEEAAFVLKESGNQMYDLERGGYNNLTSAKTEIFLEEFYNNIPNENVQKQPLLYEKKEDMKPQESLYRFSGRDLGKEWRELTAQIDAEAKLKDKKENEYF
jgi:hypothetical protein